MKRFGGVVAAALLVSAAAAYHFFFGYGGLTRVTDSVAVLTQRNVLDQIGANVVVYADGETGIVVDTQLQPLAGSKRERAEEIARAPIGLVVVTHWHPDHSGGIERYSVDTEVVAHENVFDRLSRPQQGFGLTKPGSHHTFPARTAAGLPTRAISGSFEFPTGQGAIRVVHYPRAHTDSDLVVYFDVEKVAAVGDLIWPGAFPYVDVHNGGTVAGLERALGKLLTEAAKDFRFIPGHGGVLDYDEVDAYRTMIRETRRFAEPRFVSGASADEIIAAGLPEDWAAWSSDLVPARVWLEMIAASMEAERATTR